MARLVENEGLLKDALKIYKDLYARTSSIRVLLEIARVNFELGNYQESKEAFLKSYKEGSLPQGVRSSIARYLLKIDKRIPTFIPSIGLSTDSNPMNFTSSKTVSVLGQTLNVVEPPENRSITGLNLGAKYNYPVSADSYVSIGSIIFDAPRSSFDKTSASFSVGKRNFLLDNSRLEFDLSRVWTKSNSDVLGKSLSLVRYPDVDSNWRYDLALGQDLVLDQPIYDSKYFDASATYFTNMSTNWPFEIQGGTSKVDREDLYNSNENYYLRALLTSNFSHFTPSFESGFRRTIYGSEDPFFLKQRFDSNIRHTLGLSLNSIDLEGLSPTFKVTYESNKSSIEYFSYEKIYASVTLEYM